MKQSRIDLYQRTQSELITMVECAQRDAEEKAIVIEAMQGQLDELILELASARHPEKECFSQAELERVISDG